MELDESVDKAIGPEVEVDTLDELSDNDAPSIEALSDKEIDKVLKNGVDDDARENAAPRERLLLTLPKVKPVGLDIRDPSALPNKPAPTAPPAPVTLTRLPAPLMVPKNPIARKVKPKNLPIVVTPPPAQSMPQYQGTSTTDYSTDGYENDRYQRRRDFNDDPNLVMAPKKVNPQMDFWVNKLKQPTTDQPIDTSTAEGRMELEKQAERRAINLAKRTVFDKFSQPEDIIKSWDKIISFTQA